MLRKALPIAALFAGTAFALTTLAPQDYENIPPSAADVHASLEGSLPLERLVATAAQATGGKAYSARLVDGSWIVDIASATQRFEVALSPDGSITGQKEIPAFTYPGDPIVGEQQALEGGLGYFILKEGTGAKPKGPTSTVEVHYTGYLLDGTKFDSSVDRGATIEFALNRVIRGWTLGVGDMKIGEKRKLVIPYTMGYGEKGNGSIPGKATLVFDVELFSVKE